MRVAAPSLQLHAMGAAVVGRRTPVSEMATPASELNSWDLPLPVAPAMATTVCCPESLRRAAASSRTRPASARVPLSSRVRESPTSSRRASRRERSGPSYANGAGTCGTCEAWAACAREARISRAAACCAAVVSLTRRAISPSSQDPVASSGSTGSAEALDSVRPEPPASDGTRAWSLLSFRSLASSVWSTGGRLPGVASGSPSPGRCCRGGRPGGDRVPVALGVVHLVRVVLVSDGSHRSPLLLQYGQRGDEFGLGFGVHFEGVERGEPPFAFGVHDPVQVFVEQPSGPVAQPQRPVGADPFGESPRPRSVPCGRPAARWQPGRRRPRRRARRSGRGRRPPPRRTPPARAATAVRPSRCGARRSPTRCRVR